MSIEVGALVVAIQADDAPLRRAMAEVDRLAQGYADRSAKYQKSVTEARKGVTEAQKGLNAAERDYGKLQKADEERSKKKLKTTKDQNRELLAGYQRVRSAERQLDTAKNDLTRSITARDENKLEMARARERLRSVRAISQAESDIADAKKKENKLTENEYAGKKKMQAASNRDINAQRKTALAEEADAEKRVARDRERLRKRDIEERKSVFNNHIAELQRREAHEIESDRRIFGERERLRKRELLSRKADFARLLNEKYGPVNQQLQQTTALPPGMRLRNGQLVPIPTGRAQQQGPAVPPGMRVSGGRLVPIMTPQRAPAAPRQPRAPRMPQMRQPGFDTFGITSTLVATAGVSELIRTANEMQIVQQRLAQVSGSSQEATIAFNKLSQGAQKLRQPLGETVELYTKLRQSNQNVGMSANETIKVTEAFSAALRISGATGQTAASSLLQFGQAMAKGKLDGDEFRTVAENASEVLRVLERTTGRSRGELLKMREEGKLTASMMANALIKEYDNLIDRATRLAPSLGQGATAIRNSLLIAMTNTNSAREAIEKFALSLVKVADFISENGPMVTNAVLLAGKLFALSKMWDLLRGAMNLWATRALWMVGTTGPIGLTVAALGAMVAAVQFLTMKEDEQRRKREAAISGAKTWADANRNVAEQTKRAAAAQAALNKQLKNPMAESGPLKDITDGLRKKLAEEMRLLKMAGDEVNARRDMGVSPVMTTADPTDPKGKGSKEAKDDTDDYLGALATLREKNKMVAEDARRAIGILEQEEQAYLSSTSSVERKAKAIERLEQLSRIGFMTSLDIVQITQDMNAIRDIEIANAELLAENYEKLGKEARRSADEQIKAAIKLLKIQMHSAQNDEERLALAGRIGAMQRVLYENDSFGMGTGGKPIEGDGEKTDKLTMLQRQIRNIKRSLLEAGLGTPGDLIGAYFKAMAEQTEEGGNLVAQRMKEALGKISGSIGQDLIDMGFATLAEEYKDEFKKMIGKMVGAMAGPTTILGKFLTKIKKALANPLIAGPALILVGAAMMAYSAKMGAAGRGERGGDLAGGIGGLGVGGQGQVQRYSFADRRNPIEGNRVVGMPSQPITVNQTIIGANDPIAQRQIGELVNQAARRGLVRNG